MTKHEVTLLTPEQQMRQDCEVQRQMISRSAELRAVTEDLLLRSRALIDRARSFLELEDTVEPFKGSDPL